MRTRLYPDLAVKFLAQMAEEIGLPCKCVEVGTHTIS